MWTMFVETWRTPTTKYESERKQFKNDRKTITTGEPFKKDDRVWVHQPCTGKTISRKLHQPWTGPYRVIKRISDTMYRVQLIGGRKRKVVHFNRLKPCFDRQKPIQTV